MAGLMAPLTAGAFFLGGQKQGAFANEIERQKMELAQRQAALAGRQLIQLPDGTFKVIDLAAPNAVGQTFGTPQDFSKELQSIAGVVPADMKGFVQAAIQSGDPNIQRSAYDQVIKRMGMAPKGAGGGSEKEVNPAYARAMANHHVGSIADVNAHPEWVDEANRQLAAESNARIMGRPTTSVVSSTDELGRLNQNLYRVNKGAGTASPITTTAPPTGGTGTPQRLVGTKFTGPQSAELTAVNQAQEQVPGLEQLYPSVAQKYKANGGGPWLWKQWGLYNKTTNPGGVFGRPDDDVADWFTKVGQLKGLLLTAAGSNSRNLKMVNELYGQHVVGETQDPVELMRRVKAFENEGRFDAVRRSLGVAAKGGETPTSKTATLSDRGYVELPDGIWYNPTTNKYDDGK